MSFPIRYCSVAICLVIGIEMIDNELIMKRKVLVSHLISYGKVKCVILSREVRHFIL